MNSFDKDIKIAIVGGDARQIYAGIEIANHGFEVAIFGFDLFHGDVGKCTRCETIDDAVRKSSIVILPVPVSNDNKTIFMPWSEFSLEIQHLFSMLDKDVLVFGGRVDEISYNYSNKIIDLLKLDEYNIANAYLTAESAVNIAMSEMKTSLRDYDVLVMGYGKIGKVLCSILKGMGVNVFASARKKGDFEWIRAYGYSPVDTSKVVDVISSCKLIFNTIPDMVLGSEILCNLSKDTLIVDLASKPGGVDFCAAKECGIKTVWALALPGKKLPISAGRILARTVLNMLEDEEVIR